MPDFPNEKTSYPRKPWSEAELIEHLSQGRFNLPPARLHLVEAENGRRDEGYDGILEAEWKQGHARYVFEYKASSLPRTLEAAQWQIRAAAESTKLLPLIILPYLGAEALQELEAREISGIDLCGNGVLIAPQFRVWRTGYPNQFKDTRPIRNPYRGDSSIFARCFLLRPSFESLSALQEFAQERTFEHGGKESLHSLALSTASKVVQSLVDELILEKAGNTIRLRDSARLLLFLRRNSKEPERPNILGKTPLSPQEIWERLLEAQNRDGVRGVATERTLEEIYSEKGAQNRDHVRSVATGLASASHYRVLSGIEPLSLYVDNLNAISSILEVRASRAFPNIHLFEERKNVVYFDARSEGNIRWASPIQTWLELANGGPREQEAAEELERILKSGEGEKLR